MALIELVPPYTLPARDVFTTVVETRLRYRLVIPVDVAVEKVGKTSRYMNVRLGVGAARFQQQHRIALVFAKPVREGCAGRTSPDDDIVGFDHFLFRFMRITAELPRPFDALLSIVYNLQIVPITAGLGNRRESRSELQRRHDERIEGRVPRQAAAGKTD